MTYQSPDQLNGSAAHQSVDSATYTSASHVLQGISVYSEQYSLYGKIDLFEIDTGYLRERKKYVKTIYDGQVFQLFAQCVALREMGYTVNRMAIYSMDNNTTYPVSLPEENAELFSRFEKTIEEIRLFSFSDFFQSNQQKCLRCIYEPLCPFSLEKE